MTPSKLQSKLDDKFVGGIKSKGLVGIKIRNGEIRSDSAFLHSFYGSKLTQHETDYQLFHYANGWKNID